MRGSTADSHSFYLGGATLGGFGNIIAVRARSHVPGSRAQYGWGQIAPVPTTRSGLAGWQYICARAPFPTHC